MALFQSTVPAVCDTLRGRAKEIKGLGPPDQYGLFLPDGDTNKGVWLDPDRTLEHYLQRNEVIL